MGQPSSLCCGVGAPCGSSPKGLVVTVAPQGGSLHLGPAVRYEPGQLFCEVLSLFVLWG